MSTLPPRKAFLQRNTEIRSTNVKRTRNEPLASNKRYLSAEAERKRQEKAKRASALSAFQNGMLRLHKSLWIDRDRIPIDLHRRAQCAQAIDARKYVFAIVDAREGAFFSRERGADEVSVCHTLRGRGVYCSVQSAWREFCCHFLSSIK